MKKIFFIFIVFAFTLKACAQQTFDAPVTFNAGFRFSPTGTIYLSLPSASAVDWNAITNKPLLFPPAAHNHDLLYWPINKKVDWNTDIINLPQQITLSEAIEQLGYLPIPERTTLEINSIIIPVGKSGIVKDKTLNVYKLWDGTLKSWSKIVITNQ